MPFYKGCRNQEETENPLLLGWIFLSSPSPLGVKTNSQENALPEGGVNIWQRSV